MVRTRVHARPLPWLVALAGAGVAAAGCGDALLPSDYAGPPAEGVSANVMVLGTAQAKDAAQPRLSLEWLTDQSTLPGQSSLVGQPLRFSRSVTLQTDWDIGLELPIDLATRMDLSSGASSGGLRVRVGKMVYYDDRNGNGRLDWSCRTGACDVAKAVSHEYVVYVEGATTCRSTSTAPGSIDSGRPTAGYNYYERINNGIRKLRTGEPMSFLLSDRPLPDPSDELRTFLGVLRTLWSLGLLSGSC